jgi:hypothetical protein
MSTFRFLWVWIDEHKYLLWLLFAAYLTLKSLYVLCETKTVATSAEPDRVLNAKRRLFVLHGFNLALRWGFSLAWTFSKSALSNPDLKSTIVDFLNVTVWKSLEEQVWSSKDYLQALILIDICVVVFDYGFGNDLWASTIESSSIILPLPYPIKLSKVRPLGDILSRLTAYLVDTTVVTSLSMMLALQFNFLDTFAANIFQQSINTKTAEKPLFVVAISFLVYYYAVFFVYRYFPVKITYLFIYNIYIFLNFNLKQNCSESFCLDGQ